MCEDCQTYVLADTFNGIFQKTIPPNNRNASSLSLAAFKKNRRKAPIEPPSTNPLAHPFTNHKKGPSHHSRSQLSITSFIPPNTDHSLLSIPEMDESKSEPSSPSKEKYSPPLPANRSIMITLHKEGATSVKKLERRSINVQKNRFLLCAVAVTSLFFFMLYRNFSSDFR